MVVDLTKRIALATLACALSAVGPVCAENLPDPTRPADTPAASAGVPGASAEGVPQVVRISNDRKSAIIGGQNVRVGDTYNGARVVNITESGIVLKSGSDTQTLKLFPGVEKTPSQRKAK
jgi:MSHA biogenesis protein MshK